VATPATSAPFSLPPIAPGQSFEAATTIEVELTTQRSTITSTTNTTDVACRLDASGEAAIQVTYEDTSDAVGLKRLEVSVPDPQAAREGFMASVEYATESGASTYRLTGDQIDKNSIDVVNRGDSATISFSGDVRGGSMSVKVDCH